MSALAEQRMAFIPVDDAGVPVRGLPEGHLKAVRRVVRLLDKYRAACACLETYEADFRQFRNAGSLLRLNTSEANMRRAWDALEAAIETLRPDHQNAPRRDHDGGEAGHSEMDVSTHGAPYDAAQ